MYHGNRVFSSVELVSFEITPNLCNCYLPFSYYFLLTAGFLLVDLYFLIYFLVDFLF